MKLRWKILIALGIFFALAAASSFLTLRLQPETGLEAYKKLLRDKGEKLELTEVLPPPTAPESNSVGAVEDAFRLFGSGDEKVPNAMRMVAPGKALIGWQQPEARGTDFTNSWSDFGSLVAANQPALDLLRLVLERPVLDFQLDYKKGASLPLPQLAPLKRSSQVLSAAAVWNLHNADPGAATTNILTALALVRNDTADQLLISHLVRIAMAAIAVTPTWELLQATNATDAQLAAVQKGWEQMDFLRDAQGTFVVERAWIAAEIRKARASHQAFVGALGMGSSGGSPGGSWDWSAIGESSRFAIGETMWRSSWSYADELYLLKTGQIVLETVRAMETNRSHFYKADYDAMSARLATTGLTNTGAAFFGKLEIPDFHEEFGGWAFLNTTLRKTIKMEGARDVVVTAIALKRFQLKHGKWPETLGELAPEFLAAVPIDLYDGKLLKYHPNPDGTFLLYSVGEDGTDDGGDMTPAKSPVSGTPNWNWQNGRDWVWPQPATADEVQNFYEHPPK